MPRQGSEAAAEARARGEERESVTGQEAFGIWDGGFGVWVWVGPKEARRTSQEAKPHERRDRRRKTTLKRKIAYLFAQVALVLLLLELRSQLATAHSIRKQQLLNLLPSEN